MRQPKQSLSATDSPITCKGYLNLLHANENDLGSYQALQISSFGGRSKDGAYQNIKRGFSILKINIIIQMTTMGNCCWETYDKPKFKGETQYLHYGEHFPEIQPISIKRVECRY